MNSKSDVPESKVIAELSAEFPHVDERYAGRPYRYAFMQATDPAKPYNADKAMDEGPIATVKIPVRLKYGIHGNWVPAGTFPSA